jgi:hypothetical protein
MLIWNFVLNRTKIAYEKATPPKDKNPAPVLAAASAVTCSQ